MFFLLIIYIFIGGGTTGTYYMRVWKEGYGNSINEPRSSTTANKFKYEILVTSVTPQTGSLNGGTLITIKGENFCKDINDNQVILY